MKIESLRISNFRGITEVSLEALGNMVVIAGQNGSGKSCMFDAIRLLKSVYGGYQANEWQQWMGEFQISLTNRSSDFALMFNDPLKELRITCDFRLAPEERHYIQSHADELLREKIWRTILPEAYSWGGFRMAMFAASFREREPEVAARAKAEYGQLMTELAAPLVRGAFLIPPGETPSIDDSLVLSIVFSTFRPTEIGVIDYHGAQRHYGREQVQGINLNLEAAEQQRSQSSLYNYASKYTNVKGEMAASYVKELLAEEAGIPRSAQSSLTNTLKDLFATFFPEKKFLGPQPTPEGSLKFPVETQSGNRHDLDELSAGEKEILYGYLRIRNSAPRYSIILLDEPELHLNPRLIRGLPQFYKRNLGEVLGNQIWLVTHSDALLREVVGRDSYNVFHMLPCAGVPKGQSQLKPLSATADLELALVDLVGDLAAYRPGGKVVIFEGGGDSDFDQRVTSTLFPKLQEQANLISGSNKIRVRALQETLEKATQRGQLPFKFFSVTDRDSGPPAQSSSVNVFSWDVYHIENYFLEPKFISLVLEMLNVGSVLTEEAIWDELRQCAQDTLPQLIRHELAESANAALVGAINLGTDPKGADLANLLYMSIVRSLERLNDVCSTSLTKVGLEVKESELRSKYNESLANGTWIGKCRGRDILKRFAGKHASSVSYEVFRNLLLSKMKDHGHCPKGMSIVVERILAD
jgi:predicted ATPase